ncbi:MAG: flagellar biosynthesis protein FliQ [Deltaproteobacteria bacterium]|nr:flagellar biosynthesis protein FliQ [Deltaproteobacteria bacterium]
MPNAELFIGIAKEALFLVLILTAPPVLGAMIVGLVISILQATTQIQEQTLTFVPKLVTVIVMLAFLGSQMMEQLVTFTSKLITRFPFLVQ